jgi:Mce-associated membrane protein
MEDQQPDPDDLTGQHRNGNALTVAEDDARIAATGARNRRLQLDDTPSSKRGRRRRPLGVRAGADAVDPADADAHSHNAQAERDAEATKTTDEDDGNADTDAQRRYRRWLTVVVSVAAVVFVGSVTFAGAALHTYMADRAAASTRINVARAAVAAVTTLWTYTPDTIDTLADRAAQYLSGDFNAQYRKFLEAAVTPNKQAQVTDTTEVVGAGVESLNGSDAVAIVFTNTTATSPLTKNVPSLKYVGYRLAMKREGSRWLVTNMSTVSFMDLTPQL